MTEGSPGSRGVSLQKGRLAGYLTAVAILGLDQLTKRMAVGALDLHRPLEVLGGLVRFTLVWNRGAAFSLSWGGPAILGIITSVAAIFVAVQIWRLRQRSIPFMLGLGVVLGGALGNLLDRLMYGSVIDFIDVGIGSSRWPTFNVADIAITAGGILLVLTYRKCCDTSIAEEDSDDGGD
jgi:signal peptidase II